MPRYRNLDKFLRVDQNGNSIPDWKHKVLERKKQKWIIPNEKIQYNKKEITYVAKQEKSIDTSVLKPKQKKVKHLVNHYETLNKKIELSKSNKNE